MLFGYNFVNYADKFSHFAASIVGARYKKTIHNGEDPDNQSRGLGKESCQQPKSKPGTTKDRQKNPPTVTYTHTYHIMAVTTTTTTAKAIAAKPRTKPKSSPLPVPAKPSRKHSSTATTAPSLPVTKATAVDSAMATTPLQQIATSARTPYEKRVWSLLCQIPAGHVSTYALVSAHLGSSPRAVGNALRRNPFAPQVPCHRVVATGGQLGGFKGQWPRDGEGITIDEKKRLLRSEGVRIDDKGRVLGTPWSGFV
ncbi:methylated-DNA-[protein]-cysteine S-methyltransferase [Microdochium nivale]|nr:methylated-DNA-[protein]-cysteine S-methyltransferase [Microdochium nivale]